MIFRNTARVIVIFAATAALAQSAQPGTTAGVPIPNLQGMAGRKGPVANRPVDPQSLAAMHERIEDMESTVSRMRVLLTQMRTKVARNNATDSANKANLDMWELMVGHLSKELQQLHLTLAAREDLEARRADLYRQADVKAAQAARDAQAARFAQAAKNATGTPTPTATGQTIGQSAQQSPAVQPSAAPSTNNPASQK